MVLAKAEKQTAQDVMSDPAARYRAMLARRKKNRKIAGGVILVLALIVWYLFQPLKAGMEYGICRTYLETEVPYPQTIKIIAYDLYGISMRVFYTHTDPFGIQQSEMIECLFNPDKSQGYVLEDIKLNRKSVDADKRRLFNAAIPGIVAAKPDLRIPPPLDDENLMDLQR